jgi:hypothetical protein
MTHGEQRRREIVVGLVATPPDYPARVAARLTAELAGRLAERVDADVRWTVREGWGEVAPRRDGGVEVLLDDLACRRAEARWDVAICLTDLPLHTERVPLVAQTSARRRVAMVSLPALGLGQLRAVRAPVPDLVRGVLTDASDERVPRAGWAPAELAGRVAAILRVVAPTPVERTSSRCAMNVDRFSNWCQNPYTSDRGLRIVVVAVKSIRRLPSDDGTSEQERRGAACRGTHPVPPPPPGIHPFCPGLGMSADIGAHHHEGFHAGVLGDLTALRR